MKLICPIELDKREIFIDQINSFLPVDIRVIALTKVTKNFNAKISCSKRRYHYLLPTYMLMDVKDVNIKISHQLKIQGPVVGAGENSYANFAEKGSTYYLGKEYHSKIYDELKNYRASKDKIALLNQALNVYVGTKSYHNFTTCKTPQDKESMRYIISFDCGEPFIDSKTGSEWVLCSVIGQSFLLNQIRKMIGYAAEVARGSASISQLKDSFGTKKCEVPMAPGLGLYLDELFFDFYNNKLIRHVENTSNKSENSSINTNESGVKREIPSNDDNNDQSIPTKKLKIEDKNIVINDLKDDDNEKIIDDNNKIKEEQGDAVQSEIIEWTSTSTAVNRLELFRNDIIWQHIYEEDSSNFHYMYFLDYLKVHKHCYKPTEWVYKEKKASETIESV
jgi:tRNA pseudouridine(38-40) synthase